MQPQLKRYTRQLAVQRLKHDCQLVQNGHSLEMLTNDRDEFQEKWLQRWIVFDGGCTVGFNSKARPGEGRTVVVGRKGGLESEWEKKKEREGSTKKGEKKKVQLWRNTRKDEKRENEIGQGFETIYCLFFVYLLLFLIGIGQ